MSKPIFNELLAFRNLLDNPNVAEIARHALSDLEAIANESNKD